jgi:1,4-alpha-glucan branching enzyme
MPYVEGFGTWPFGEEWLWEAVATCYCRCSTCSTRARGA